MLIAQHSLLLTGQVQGPALAPGAGNAIAWVLLLTTPLHTALTASPCLPLQVMHMGQRLHQMAALRATLIAARGGPRYRKYLESARSQAGTLTAAVTDLEERVAVLKRQKADGEAFRSEHRGGWPGFAHYESQTDCHDQVLHSLGVCWHSGGLGCGVADGCAVRACGSARPCMTRRLLCSCLAAVVPQSCPLPQPCHSGIACICLGQNVGPASCPCPVQGMRGQGLGETHVDLTSVPLPYPAERKLGDMATAVGGVQNEILELEGQEAVLLQQLSHLRERLDTVRAKKVGECDACEQPESSVSTSEFEAKGCDGGAVMLQLQDVAWMRKLLDGPHQGSQLRGAGHCAGHRAGWQSEGVYSAGRLFITLQESAAPLCSAVALSCWGLPL